MIRSPSLTNILEANTAELSALELLEATSIEVKYGLCCLYFLRADRARFVEHMKSWVAGNHEAGEDQIVIAAVQLRLKILDREFDEQLVSRVIQFSERTDRWRGELSLLAATAYSFQGDYENGKKWYRNAALALEKQGCPKKALRSRMNALVCETYLEPGRQFINSYHDLYRASLRKKSRDLIVTTTCLLNISREYQKMGAKLAALKFCNKALELSEFQFGTLSHHLLIAHRAHLFADLGRKSEARSDLELLTTSSFVEIQSALPAIAELIDENIHIKIDDSKMTAAWRLRLQKTGEEPVKQPRLSPLEEKLLIFLGARRRNRIDILEHLYGPALSYETKLNRFKSLLSSLRKKHANLVRYEDDHYLLEESGLPPFARSQSSKGA